MFTTCYVCAAPLERNQVLEEMPVGRRLAFNQRSGRLWVVCRQCERWNLSPVEERWEAIEACERLFRDTRLRVSTDNIGLARVRGGWIWCASESRSDPSSRPGGTVISSGGGGRGMR